MGISNKTNKNKILRTEKISCVIDQSEIKQNIVDELAKTKF